MSRRAAVLVTAFSCAALLPGVAQAGDRGGGFSPGAPGIGDPYYPLDGNGGYDVAHYDLDVRYDPATDVLTGVATIEARATQGLSSFNLDLQGMEVRSITVQGEEATWTRDGGELTVTPACGLPADHEFTTVVAYDGVPGTLTDALGSSGFMHTDDGAIVAGQPHGAATWFPANDHPRDAASVTVTATVPAGLEAVSNGELRSHADTAGEDGWTTWSWNAREPMATYLVTLAIGEFDLHEHSADGIRYWDALDPDLATLDLDPDSEGPPAGAVATASLARQPEVIAFLSDFFGRYPFRTAGGIVDDAPELTFALETQTRPVYSRLYFGNQRSGDLGVVHQLAHQWYGDALRLDSWQHIWLNEGFATYATWLWLEHEGLSSPQAEFDDIAANAPPEFWQTTIGNPGPDVEQLFGEPVFQRGAMTLQALRNTVGDETFFDIVRSWTAAQAGGTVTTDEFVALAEEESGQQLDELFRIWLSTPEKPAELG
jgi:aminopeptidase N